MRKYTVHGPFYINKEKGFIDRDFVNKAFWDGVVKKVPSLQNGVGCYLFAVKTKGYKPWYVGQTKRAFCKECFAQPKLWIYDNVLKFVKTGKPCLFFVVKRTNKDKLAAARAGKNLENERNRIETLLIDMALAKNPDLKNVKKAKILKKLCIPGVINTPQGPPTDDVSEFKKCLAC